MPTITDDRQVTVEQADAAFDTLIDWYLQRGIDHETLRALALGDSPSEDEFLTQLSALRRRVQGEVAQPSRNGNDRPLAASPAAEPDDQVITMIIGRVAAERLRGIIRRNDQFDGRAIRIRAMGKTRASVSGSRSNLRQLAEELRRLAEEEMSSSTTKERLDGRRDARS
jgi:hypothetical protein